MLKYSSAVPQTAPKSLQSDHTVEKTEYYKLHEVRIYCRTVVLDYNIFSKVGMMHWQRLATVNLSQFVFVLFIQVIYKKLSGRHCHTQTADRRALLSVLFRANKPTHSRGNMVTPIYCFLFHNVEGV